MRICLLIYDVPDGSIPMNRHPCNVLPRLAIRIQLSGWIVPDGSIPYNYLNYLSENHVTWNVVKFDKDENEKLMRMAVNSLRAEIREKISSAKISAASACEKFTDETLTTAEKFKKYDAQTKATITRLKKSLNNLKVAAATFGIDEGQINLGEAYTQCQAIQQSMATRAKEYSLAVNALAAEMGDNDPMVRAGRADRVPAGIMADYMEDRNVNATRLRKAFGDMFN